MASDLTRDFGSTVSIPIPTIPTSFYPGATPYSALMGAQSSASANVRAVAFGTSAVVSRAGSSSRPAQTGSFLTKPTTAAAGSTMGPTAAAVQGVCAPSAGQGRGAARYGGHRRHGHRH
jgi:rhamnogalacturonan hydrolase